MLNQNNEEFSKLARNSTFLMEFLGDVTVYADRRSALSVNPVASAEQLAKMEEPKVSPVEVLTQSVVEKTTTPVPKPAFLVKSEKLQPTVAVWLGKVNGQIPAVVDKMLEAIGLSRELCLFWADHDIHPVQLCKDQPEIRKVLVLAPSGHFPKLKPEAPLFHEGVTYLRSWDTASLDKDVEAKKMLWKLMKTHFLNKK